MCSQSLCETVPWRHTSCRKTSVCINLGSIDLSMVPDMTVTVKGCWVTFVLCIFDVGNLPVSPE